MAVRKEKFFLKFMLSNEPSTNFCVTLRDRYKLWGLSAHVFSYYCLLLPINKNLLLCMKILWKIMQSFELIFARIFTGHFYI